MTTKPLVWIIDDDDISKYVMKRNLKELDILNSVDFPDSIQPLEILSKNRKNEDELPDIIFLDLNMPILNGFQFIEEFNTYQNEIEKKIHIFMLTSSLNNKDLARAMAEPSISEYFIKPINFEQLGLAVENISEKLNEV